VGPNVAEVALGPVYLQDEQEAGNRWLPGPQALAC
jgi:hypothetical protein